MQSSVENLSHPFPKMLIWIPKLKNVAPIRVGFLDTLPLPYWESKTPCGICPETFVKACEYFLLGVRGSGPNYVQVVLENV